LLLFLQKKKRFLCLARFCGFRHAHEKSAARGGDEETMPTTTLKLP